MRPLCRFNHTPGISSLYVGSVPSSEFISLILFVVSFIFLTYYMAGRPETGP